MNLNDDDDGSVFEQALRADLPSIAEQNRLRPRILAAGVAVGTALGSTSVAAATQASFGASALSKLGALSWPSKLGLTALLVAPITVAVLPLVATPVPGAEIVSQVRSSAVAVHARSATKASPPAEPPALAAPQTAEPAPEPEPAVVNVAARATVAPSTPAVSTASAPVIPTASPSAAASAGSAEPAVAAFDSAPHETATSEPAPQRNASTLAAETQLLDRAFAALAAGDRTTAAALVSEHARQFPNGILRQERERARARLAHDSTGE